MSGWGGGSFERKLRIIIRIWEQVYTLVLVFKSLYEGQDDN